jgi:2-succinyl-6-hydroxy-2,4-cyclohexadiene-1-carboxylate synthase
MDLPGHGRHTGETDPAQFTLSRVFDSIEEASARQPVDLVGYSMGGRLALAYAVAHPHRVRRLVLESASPGLADPVDRERRRAADAALAERIEGDGVEAFVDYWEELPLFESQAALPARVRETSRALRLQNHAGSLAASLRGLGTGSQPSYWDALPTLDVPMLLLVGAHDLKFTEIGRRMSVSAPRSRLEVVAGAGHAVHLERQDAWLYAVAGWLTE